MGINEAQALAAIVFAVAAAVVMYVRSKLASDKNSKKQNAMAELLDAVDSVVVATNQTVVQGLKEASKDGKLDKDEAAKIRDNVINGSLAHISSSAKKTLEKEYPELNKVVGTLVEKAVRLNK